MGQPGSQDPAGLLQRIIELQSLCAVDPAVRRAVASGDAFKVYRALWWGRLTGRLGAHRSMVDALLRNRRAFARPLSGGGPSLGRVNGFGAALLGRAEAGADGTFIATHAIVALFVVPLFPLGAYVVLREGSSGLSTSWRIFARVPLGTAAWAWQRAVAAGVVLAVLVGAGNAFHASRHHDVHVANGLGVPIHATLGPAAVDVPPGEQRSVNVPLGALPARAATAGGAVVDEGPFPVEVGRDLLVWNVGGAAPVMERVLVYGATGNNADPEPVFHCGERRISLRGVDYRFEQPPHQISVSKGSGPTLRRAVQVHHEQGAEGIDLCAYLLTQRKEAARAAGLFELKARLGGWDPGLANQAVWAAAQVSPAEAVRVARAYRDAHPDDVLAHRTYQSAAERAGVAGLVEEYRQRAEAAPQSASAQYLAARVLPRAERTLAAEELVKRFPEDPDVLRFACGAREDAGDHAGADRAWRELRRRSAEKAGMVLDVEVDALAAMGQQAEALRVIDELFPALKAGAQEDAALLYALAAQRVPGAEPGRLVARVAPEEAGRLRAAAGLPAAGGEPSPPERLERAAAVDPAQALAQIGERGAFGLLGLDGVTRALLHAEAIRARHASLAQFEAVSQLEPAELAAFTRFVRGEPGMTLPALSADQRAAAELVRSRNAALPEAERAALRAAALRDDVLGTIVTRAVKAWPAPAP